MGSTMGDHLRGASPPFTGTGGTAFMKSTNMGGKKGTKLGQAGHSGILAILRCDREKVISLLPPPLEPVPHSEIVGLFVNQTQSGLPRFQLEGEEGLGFLNRLSPHHINWHEAFFKIPCMINGVKAVLFHSLYVDVDYKIVQGIYDGFVTKVATFHETYPVPGQSANDRMAPGRTARIQLARHDERIMTLDFVAEREIPEDQCQQIIDVVEWWHVCGLRVFPDYANPGGPPLVQQLIMWDMAAGKIAQAWAGKANVDFGPSDWEELHLLQPVEVLESFFVHYQYQAGPGRCHILHDYVRDPL